MIVKEQEGEQSSGGCCGGGPRSRSYSTTNDNYNNNSTNTCNNNHNNSTQSIFPPNANAGYDYFIKLLVIGDSGVGKTSILTRYADDTFTHTFINTIGIDFKVRTVEIDGKKVKLRIWDTAGQERFKTITTAYYRGAMGIMLVYDVTDENSFNSIRNWMRNIEQHANESVNRVLIGNKCDLVETRVVEASKGQALADEYGIKFMEASAKSSINVEEIFLILTKDVIKRLNVPQKEEFWKTEAAEKL